MLAIVGAFIGWLKWLEREGEKYSEKNNLAEVEATVTPEEFEKIQMGTNWMRIISSSEKNAEHLKICRIVMTTQI